MKGFTRWRAPRVAQRRFEGLAHREERVVLRALRAGAVNDAEVVEQKARAVALDAATGALVDVELRAVHGVAHEMRNQRS